MKRLLFVVAGILAIPVAKAHETQQVAQQGETALSPRAKVMLKHFGGFIDDKRSQKGSIAIVNAQNSAKSEWLLEAGNIFAKDLRISVNVVPGAFEMGNPSLAGSVTIFVVEDAKLPISLVAPEAHWAVVNITSLKSSSEAFFKSRVSKAVTRAMVLLLGGADSQYPMCIMGNIGKASDLDKYPDSRLPVDVLDRIQKNMGVVGIVPYKIVTYRKACEEGWAPQPTNDIQRAVWDKVHAIPDKPITIEYDPKKDK